MPVTKKKGAIFAIYADSPTAPTSSSIAPQLSPSKRSKPKSAFASDAKTSVAPLSGSTRRKALSSLQASAVKARVESSDSKTLDVEKTAGKPAASSVNAKPSTSTSVKRIPSVRKPKSSAPKRQIEALSSPHLPSTSTFTSSALPAPPTDKSTVRFKETPSAKSYESPLKKGRLTTPSRSTTKDKENIPPPPLDSPASRTRSKTRRHANSISSLAALGINSPVQPLFRARPQRTDSGVSEHSGLSALVLAPGPAMADLGEDTLEEVRTLVGSGRGALSLKKGRALAGILGSGVDLGDDETLDLGFGPLVDVPSPPGSKSKSKSRGKGFWREGDGPLADVSEAYGAVGEAPEGFATQGGA